MKAKNQKSVSERSNALKGLQGANKETRTLSGSIKIIATFWGKGYNKAFNHVGIKDKKELTFEGIKKLCQKDKEGVIYITIKKAKKNDEGEFILDKDNKRVYEYRDTPVKENQWTPSKLFKILEQSINSNK